MEYTDERGVFVLRWARKVKGVWYRARTKPFKIYIRYF
nr:MAG TPA: hypothetical protein [Caudoviricetes sp.]